MAAAAAAAATSMSCWASPMGARAGFKGYSSLGLPRIHAPPHRPTMRVRCQAEEKATPPSDTSNVQPAAPVTPPPPKPKVSTKFGDVLAFSGPAPERINGRLAMIGFVAAVGVELASGNDLAQQLTGGGLQWFVATAAVLSAASLIPLFKGVTVQSKSEGLMSADAEMWNGRLAMLGLVALAFTEYVKGGPLV